MRITRIARGVLLVVACGLASPAWATTWSLYTVNPTPITAVKALQEAADQVARETNNDLTIRVHLGGTLQIQAGDVTQAVSDSIVQIGDDQQFGGTVPIGALLRLPALLRTEAEYQKAATILLPYVKEGYKKYDVTVLATYYYPPLVIFSKPKITSLDDIRGKKIRALSAESAEWVRRFGGIPISLSFPELGPGLDRGVADGMTTASSGGGYVLKDLIKYNYRIPIAFSNVFVIVNNDALAALKPATRDAVIRIFGQTMNSVSSKIMAEEDELTQKMAAGGVVVTHPTPEEIARAETEMASYWDVWAKDRGPAAVEALAKIRAAIGR